MSEEKRRNREKAENPDAKQVLVTRYKPTFTDIANHRLVIVVHQDNSVTVAKNNLGPRAVRIV